LFFVLQDVFLSVKNSLNLRLPKTSCIRLSLGRPNGSNGDLRNLIPMGRKVKGRPPLESGKRDKRIDTRFTQAEMEQIESLEKTLGICRTDLIRQRLLGNAKTQVVNASELLLELDKIGAELARAGNNINQLARHANTIKLRGDLPASLVTAFNGLLTDYVRKQAALEVSLRKIIRAISLR
jgi:hypothetical protein